MGADIHELEDGLLIRKSNLVGTHVHSHQDHRLAMSLAVAGLGAGGDTFVHPVECVKKTYSTFVKDFQVLGANLAEVP